jgi:hypothetical protein
MAILDKTPLNEEVSGGAGGIGTSEIAAGALAASTAGRAIMAASYFNNATVDAKFAADAFGADATGRALFEAGFFNNAAVDDLFAVDAFGADATGRALFEAGFFDEATVDDLFAASSIDDNILKALGTTYAMGGRDAGRAPVGYVYFTGVAADADTVTINSRVYEFDDDASTTGDVDVDITGDATADAACTALAAAINADESRDVDAVVWAGNDDTSAGVTLIGTAAGSTNFTLAKSATNGVVSAANLTGAAVAAQKTLWAGTYTVTAADVTALALGGGDEVAIAGITSTSAPTLVSALCLQSGAVVALTGVIFKFTQANSNLYALIVEDGSAALTAGDVISFAAVV